MANVKRLLRTLDAVVTKWHCDGDGVKSKHALDWEQFDFVCQFFLKDIKLCDFLSKQAYDDILDEFHDACLNEWDGFVCWDVDNAVMKLDALLDQLYAL